MSEEYQYDDKISHNGMGNGEPLSRQMTMQLTSEQYERLFFQPTAARGDLAKRLGNPTLLGLFGFLLPFQTAMFCLMGFQGGTASSLIAVSGSFYTFGGIAMVLAGLAEFILGNTFPFTVFTIYGCHWVAQGYSNSPIANLAAAYGAEGALDPAYNAGAGFYNLTFVLISFCFLIGSLRTNVPFVIVFVCLVILYALLAAANFHIGAHGLAGLPMAGNLIKAAGAVGFIAAIMGWYLAIITVCASTGVPCPLPVFDLSGKVFPASQAAKNEAAGAGGSTVARTAA